MAVQLDSHSRKFAEILRRQNRWRYYKRRAKWFHLCTQSGRIIWPGQRAMMGQKKVEPYLPLGGGKYIYAWMRNDEYVMWQLKKSPE